MEWMGWMGWMGWLRMDRELGWNSKDERVRMNEELG